MSKVGDITFEKDILEAVEKKLPQYFPETIKDVWKFTKKQITKLCGNHEIGAIYIPFLGIMYRSYHIVERQIKELEYIEKNKKKNVRAKLSKLRKIKKMMDDEIQGNYRSIHMRKNNFNSYYLRKGMTSNKDLENYQNSDE